MKNLHISVKEKVATYTSRDGIIVCDNKDYQLVIQFDAEWEAIPNRTARFIWNQQHVDVPFTGNTVAIPPISNTETVIVGIYTENICTTAVIIPCVLSVLCEWV